MSEYSDNDQIVLAFVSMFSLLAGELDALDLIKLERLSDGLKNIAKSYEGKGQNQTASILNTTANGLRSSLKNGSTIFQVIDGGKHEDGK